MAGVKKRGTGKHYHELGEAEDYNDIMQIYHSEEEASEVIKKAGFGKNT